MTTPIPDGDEFTELVDADIARVDLVDKAANGLSFLIAKQADGTPGLLDPGFVRELIAKSEPEDKETVTMTGSPGAIAKLIHEAGRKPSEPAPTEITKDAAEEAVGADGPDLTEALADTADEAPGDPAAPGSPAWEAVDAATARKWTSILARAKHAVSMLADREMTEGVTVDPGDIDNALDLEDACCAIDYAISVLAPFAVAEQAEADCAAEQMAAVGKALGDWDTEPLDTIEALAHVAKAGRVLSTGNEAAIRGAVEQLQKVLASLPAAPETTEDGDRPVAKQEDTVADATQVAAPATEPVVKADPVPQVPIYNRKGDLVGIVDPASIIPIAMDEPDDEDEAVESDDVAVAAADGPTPEIPDLTPEPSAEAGIPADAVPEDDVMKNPEDTTTSDAESSNTDVTKSPDGHSAAQEQAFAKQAEDMAQLVETVETLKAQIRTLEEQPAEPKVFTNGAVPPAHQLRGQDRGAPTADMAKAQELKKSLYQGPDAVGQNAIHNQLNEMAIAALQDIHNGGARP